MSVVYMTSSLPRSIIRTSSLVPGNTQNSRLIHVLKHPFTVCLRQLTDINARISGTKAPGPVLSINRQALSKSLSGGQASLGSLSSTLGQHRQLARRRRTLLTALSTVSKFICKKAGCRAWTPGGVPTIAHRQLYYYR